ncbi:MAG: hypothetical protein AAGF97_09510, partial [Planctomycetota bacterium]
GIYAETDIALAVAHKHALVLIEPSLNLLATIPHAFTSRHIEFMSLGDAFKLPDRRFIKPADCTNKAFDTSVWERGASIFCADDLSRDTRVLVSAPVEWSVEYRVVVHERAVVTFSPYIRDGWLATPRAGGRTQRQRQMRCSRSADSSYATSALSSLPRSYWTSV